MNRNPWSRWPDADIAEAIEMYKAGKTIREIAEWFGRAVGSVHSVLSRHGVQMRPAVRTKRSA